jgi:hypothetical protein
VKSLADMGVSITTVEALRSAALRNQTPAAVNPRLFRVIGDCQEELAGGAIIIAEDEGYRVRRLPIRH